MDKRLTGPELVKYLRQFPSSDDRGWAADEIERLRAALDDIIGMAEAGRMIHVINRARTALAQEQGGGNAE